MKERDLIARYHASYEEDLTRIFRENELRERAAFLAGAEKAIAGAEAETSAKETLFARHTTGLGAGVRLTGALSCLRDNSPESARFMELARETLWEHWTAEELAEMVREAGWRLEAQRFMALPRWNETILKGRLAFDGFYPIFERMMAEGFDPAEIGWGELRFVARRDAG